MRQFLFSLFFCGVFAPVFAQSVAINTDGSSAHSSSILDVKSTNKGVLIPRMTTAQRNAIASPATGLLIFNTSTNTFQFRQGTVWVNLNNEAVLRDADGDTKIQVEKNANDNNIRFDISGVERMNLLNNASGVTRLELKSINQNTFVGDLAGQSVTTGSNNTALGRWVLVANTTGNNNTAVGPTALRHNEAGSANTAVGASALYRNETGINNTALGNSSLINNVSGSVNVGLGSTVLYSNTTGGTNTAIGSSAMFTNTTGSGNLAVGSYSLFYNTTSFNNVAIGKQAAFTYDQGGQNTFLGAYAESNASGYSNSTALGYQATISASNQVRVGNASVTSIGGHQNWTNVSDARLKTDVKTDVPGLDFINRLRPVTYQLDRNKIRQSLGQEPTERDTPGQRSTGFLAQEVEAAAQALGFAFSGVDAPKNEQDFYGLRYAEFSVPLVKAVQELDAENKQLKAALAELTKRLEALEAARK